MQFTLITILSFVAIAIATRMLSQVSTRRPIFVVHSPLSAPRINGAIYFPPADKNTAIQLAARAVDASTASMTDAQGNVVSFDSASVNQGTLHKFFFSFPEHMIVFSVRSLSFHFQRSISLVY